MWLNWFILPMVAPDKGQYAMLGGIVGGLLVVLWWVFLSRAPWSERLGGVALMIVAVIATRPLLHESMATAGMGFLFYIYAIPVLALAFVVWAVVTRNLTGGARWVTMVIAIALGCGVWTLVRTGGISNSGESDFAWRWAKTPEERLLAWAGDEPTARGSVSLALEAEAEWPGFRGPDRDSHARGAQIETDWSASPPVELWRRPVGPGWSSFAVHGDRFYTQEQRGDDEVVSCYNATTGEPVWRHDDATRFWESNAGAGPRATPTLSDGRVYTFGANGTLNVLNAFDGTVIWSRDVAADTQIEVPMWGFSSSPLVVDDVVIVAAVGKLAAYDRATGDPRWFGPDGGDGYSSPHLLTIDDVEQVVQMSLSGAISVAPADGTVLWNYDWKGGTRIVQPAATADGDLLMSRGVTTGINRVAVSLGSDGWNVEERWGSNRLKPYFSDFVIHEGHAYGFDGNILAAIDVEDGKRKWKGGRYGSGQLLLLPDQDLLLVVSEKGELALVSATPEKFDEVGRFPAVEGKTWNHPVLVDDLLLVRNSEEMVAFRLPLAAG
jgi:outer membrane protein assembly factor BamB